LLSTGESTLATQMAEGGKRPKAGQDLRLLSVPATREHGVFDDLHGFPSGRALTDHLKTATSRHYGHAGPAFVEALLRDGRDFGAALAEVEALPQFKPEGGQESRAASRFALFGMAGELAAEWDILPWAGGKALEAAAECYRLWRDMRGKGAAEDRQILQAVSDFVTRHEDGRFSRKGVDGPPVRDRAGWWIEEEGGRVFLLRPEALREATKGHDSRTVSETLDKAGWIADRTRDGSGRYTKKTDVGGGRKPWLYWLRLGDIDE
jgi:putative DNA primase/helicase